MRYEGNRSRKCGCTWHGFHCTKTDVKTGRNQRLYYVRHACTIVIIFATALSHDMKIMAVFIAPVNVMTSFVGVWRFPEFIYLRSAACKEMDRIKKSLVCKNKQNKKGTETGLKKKQNKTKHKRNKNTWRTAWKKYVVPTASKYKSFTHSRVGEKNDKNQ